MSTQSQTKTIWLIMAAAIIAGTAGWWFGQMGRDAEDKPSFASLQTYPKPRDIVSANMVNQHNATFTPADWRGQWDLVFFGFTNCPDICPNTLHQLKTTLGQLPPEQQSEVNVTLVSVDPDRDQPQQLKRYIDYFDPRYHAVTGADADIAKLARSLAVAYEVAEHAPDDISYEVSHSAAVLVVDPAGKLYGLFSAPINPDLMLQDLERLTTNG